MFHQHLAEVDALPLSPTVSDPHFRTCSKQFTCVRPV